MDAHEIPGEKSLIFSTVLHVQGQNYDFLNSTKCTVRSRKLNIYL